jgi:CPA1 family monovalent cation:H+ antiporter
MATAVLAVPLALVARLVSVAVPASLPRESWRDKGQNVVVLTWAGLRGGISLALALPLPGSPVRVALLVVADTVVVVTVLAHGLTMPRVLARVYAMTPSA